MTDRYDPKVEEEKWVLNWEKNGIFKFNPESKAEVYSIDTPPPTVSGKMHIGHAFSYTQQDIIARYKRLRGFNVFYPFGTDDNGLATIRLIEKTKNVKEQRMSRDGDVTAPITGEKIVVKRLFDIGDLLRRERKSRKVQS